MIKACVEEASSSGAELIGSNVVGSPGSEIPSSTKAGSMAPAMPNSTAIDEPVDTVSRTSTVQLNMKRSLPLQIPTAVIQQAHFMDIKGWPPSLAPSCVTCGLCSSPLSREKSHPGQRGESLVLTNLNPFKKIKLLVKFCQSPSCQAMHQVFTYDIGMFNISDKLLVSLEILVEWRHLFRRGVPISTAIESKLEAMAERVLEYPGGNELKNIANLLYNGFYCFEAITDRSLDYVICGICGTVGELYLGDGNEKIVAVLINYQPPQGATDNPLSLENFMVQLRERWVECTTYTRCSKKFQVYQTAIPPIMAPSMQSSVVLNTEGDPALLHDTISKKGVDISALDLMSAEHIKDVCEKCNIATSRKSLVYTKRILYFDRGFDLDYTRTKLSAYGELNAMMKIDIQGLYESLLVGSCPCHEFTKVDGHTGGFYNIVCRHGVTAASKFLTLQESVRDPADLYLSFKHYPLLFICDTPCGFVRHMDCREPTTTKQLWGSYSGCLEQPTLGKKPSKDISVPDMVPAEYRDVSKPLPTSDTGNAHPLTGSGRRDIQVFENNMQISLGVTSYTQPNFNSG
ncbi:HMG domain-containing protein 3-like [Montipora foliosa]|uniref:HMG domain-containing protein 3-like n=1 Tax=Montipora foliosa TaxID=591990 RepID=UPI0035F183C4